MKTIRNIAAWAAAALLFAFSMTSCDGNTGGSSSANGRPYELIVSIPQDYWDGEMGDTIRTVFQTPVDMINQYEPMFDIQRINPESLKGLFIRHRNILNIRITPEVDKVTSAVQYEAYGKGQVLVTLAAPNGNSMTRYLADHKDELLQIFEIGERDRDIEHNHRYGERHVESELEKLLGVKMNIPPGFKVKKLWKDGAWIGFEYPLASQGVLIYTYPYTGSADFEEAALTAKRNEFVKRIPGPSEGSYMVTSDAITPEANYMLINGRPWAETRGFWDVAGDFMGGPFVSYSTHDATNGRIITLEGYVFSPKHPKRNLLRSLEHLVYSVEVTAPTTEE